MNSVKFGDKDSYKDFSLILKPKGRPLASPKINTIDIEGKDGSLDLTTALTGDVKYNNIEYELEFTMKDNREDWEAKLLEIATYLQGKKMPVIFSEDPDWYLMGRMTIDGIANSRNIGTIKINCDFEPYRLKVNETIINETIEAGKVITLSNSRKWVMPTIEVYSKNKADINDSTNEVANRWNFKVANIKGGKEYSLYLNVSGTVSINLRYENSSGTIINTAYNLTGKNVVNFTSVQDGVLHLQCFEPDSGTYNVIPQIMLVEGIYTLENIGEYEPYTEANVNLDFEGNSYTINGILKTPNIILKEGGSKITLTDGQGNIKISYREGKL